MDKTKVSEKAPTNKLSGISLLPVSFRKRTFIEVFCKMCGVRYSDDGEYEKVFQDKAEATHLCNDSKRCIIKYANCVRGKIAQICDWYEPTRDLGTTVHYHINEMTVNQLASDEVFVIRCKIMKTDPYVFAKFIYDSQ